MVEQSLSKKKVIAIIPAYNEEDNICSVIDDLIAQAPEVDYIVVNDGSKDETGFVCSQNGFRCVSLPVNLGLTHAFQAGMKYARMRDYDYAIQFDADGQHSAAYIGALVEKAIADDACIVIGSRFLSRRKPFSLRMAGSVLLSTAIKLTTGVTIRDPTSGMRLYSKKMIDLFAERGDFAPEPDMLAFVIRNGFKVSEVKVEMRERIAGESYLTLSRSVSYMLQMCVSILFVQRFRKGIQ